LPDGYLQAGKPAFRSLTMNGREIEFSEGFTELHTAAYREVLAGRGFGLAEAKPSVDLVYALRSAEVIAKPSLAHPMLQRARSAVPPAFGTMPPPGAR
jgi:UDP-N-acetyl-2-amino-2-deoxyglucuronate dehydrogenase